ncbi:hypothetical protein [Flagellimonas nanhaiensis]|uniref:Uncharacterized protein n=1 Tax=Flagellimonas nanhaiensis TaxID=2292706 RepID=A0A371JL88_9FLAO|nr:hypothetical protein [Allomuricauda nanhaiensis]RDY57708.1 hypothetical protein DX873_17570 [Allomuricauda nanhaiensis]
MSGNILQAARADAKKILSSSGFEEDITLTTPDGQTTITTKGLTTKHHLDFDTEGPVNSKKVHICIDESDLEAKAYPVRNSVNEVDLREHIITVSDSTGNAREYLVSQLFPNETLGLIVCVLEDYSN